MYLNFKLFIEQNQLLTENQQLDSGIEQLLSLTKSNETPPITQNPKEKKSWIREFWNNHKNKIIIGSLTTAAIAALYLSGISITGLGIGGGIKALFNGDISSNDILNKIAGKPITALLSNYNDVFVKNGDNWIPVSREDLIKLAQAATPSGDGLKIKLLKAADSRVSNELKTLELLKQFGLDDDNIFMSDQIWNGE